MALFVGRDRELKILEEEIKKISPDGSGRFVWVLGRRRVGKSRLVEEFLQRSGIRHVFYRAPRRRSADVALQRFGIALSDSNLPAAELAHAGAGFRSWPAALRLAAEGATPKEPLAIVLDELPYLVETDPGIAADIQEAWDRHLEGRPVLLIAIGSDIRMMRLLTEHPSELHGRPTRELPVHPFNPAEIGALTGTAGVAAFERYLTVGGYPALALSWRVGTSRRAFLETALADTATPVVVNAMRIVEAEFEAELKAREVVEAIGCGEVAFRRIRERSGIRNQTSLSAALNTLVERKRMVSADLPFAAPPGKKQKRYTVADPYLRFWLRFIGPNLDEIDRGRSDLVIERIERDWVTFQGKSIEPVARDSIERLLADPAFRERLGGARYVGGYWNRTGDVEVDLVGARDRDPKQVSFIGSIKWRARRAFRRGDALALASQRNAVPGADGKAPLVGVSARGFERNIPLDVQLSPDDLIAAWDGGAA